MIDTRQLRAYGRRPPQPLSLTLDDGRSLQILQWLRILPGKRLVGQALLDGELVLAKLFIAHGAERHWSREKQGVEALQLKAIPTPGLVASGRIPGGGHYLLTRFLSGAQTQQQRWEALSSSEPASAEAQGLVAEVVAMLARMHAQGLTQSDLHMGNFLWHQGQLYVIDGDAVSVQSSSEALNARDAADNLGAFFAQLPVAWEEQLELLLVGYLGVNSARAIDPQRVLQALERGRQWRLQDYLGKALRDCSLFSVRRNWWRFLSIKRSESAELLPVMNEPDSLFDSEPLLKDGGSSTVTRFTRGERTLVVKRYNIKSLGHWLRRFWRPSRAWHSWLAAHRLQFLDIATPAPLAMCESRFGPLRRRAWLVTEFCPGQDLLSLFDPTGQELPAPEQCQALLKVFSELARQRISHGDCKATNLLWHQGRVWLIDLDAMQAHSSEAAWRRAWAEDRARLIRNWPAGSPLGLWLDEQLPR
ncbi:lipopolysaccharide kinase InaA family protein [Pseudomonas jilinensis]|uniref:Serine/threonine protein kinase n=1 Tax=Pseudomonas jilinensis TaxID=2078689 RepID=A0A396SGY7_9PSED|nr:lipopolysaccharide kinase InaA family protein [Pseudomonas jilinensis]RHW22977.1 hypothetical protein C2846_00790 [Pseudomonas jilinensis]